MHLSDVQEVLALIKENSHCRNELLDILLTDAGKKEATNVAWIFTHLSARELSFLNPYQSELITIVMKSTSDNTMRRLVMSLLHRLVLNMNIEFFNFCLNTLSDKEITVGIRSLAIRLAFQLCVAIPEMCAELQYLLQLLDTSELPAVESAKNQILKKIDGLLS